jgi:hypothetical protein
MVTLTDIKEVLGIDIGDSSEDHYLQNLIRRASFRISSACNRQLEYSVLIEYFNCNNSNMLYLKNWPVWEILQLQEFNSEVGDYVDRITGSGDTIENSVYIYEGRNSGLIRLLKNYTFGSHRINKSGSDYNIRIKYRAGYKNIVGTGSVYGKAGIAEVIGDGTKFEKEIRMEDRIVTKNYEYTVTEILSDTFLKLSCNIESSFAGESFRICNVPADLAEAVLMLAAGSYLIKKYEAYGMDQKTENILSVTYSKIQDVVESSNLTPNVKMRFREFDFSSVVEV